MHETWRIDATRLRPYNDAPAYLSGEVTVDDFDNLVIRGRATQQLQGWHSLGARSGWLEPESFELFVSTISSKDLGACSTGVLGEDKIPSISVSHFVRSSVSLHKTTLIPNFYSGWGYDNSGSRSQVGLPAEWQVTGRHHNFMLRYDHERGVLSCFANDVLVHAIQALLSRFRLVFRVEAVGVEGEFAFCFERLMYRPLGGGQTNRTLLNCWLPEYSPTFISYAHADKDQVESLVAWLRSRGVRLRGDWEIRGGGSLLARISQFISKASFLLVALSPSSAKSRWVSKELEIALSQQLAGTIPLTVIPVVLAPCEIPAFLAGTLRFDLSRPDQEAERRKLLEALSFRQRW